MKMLGDLAAIVTLIGGLAFTVTYAAMVRWWRSWVGRAIMGLSVCLASAFALVVVSLYFGTEWPYRNTIRLVIFLGCGVPLWILEIALITGQINKHENAQERITHGTDS